MIKKVLKYILLGILLLVVLWEILLRIFFFEQLKTQSYPLIYRTDSITGYLLIPNIVGYISQPSIDHRFQLNNHGFMGNDFTIVKKKGEVRVAIIGNSITEGIWMNSNENYVVKLQKMFYKDGYTQVKIINCSMGGINKDIRNYLLIKHYISTYNPNIILFNVGIPFSNDNETRGIYKNYMIRYAQNSVSSKQMVIKKIDNLQNHKLFTTIYDISYIYRAYCKKYSEKNYDEKADLINVYRGKSSDAQDILTYQYSLETSMKLLQELKNTLNDKKETLIIWPFQLDSTINKSLIDYKIPFIYPIVKLDHDMIYKHDGHPNEKGHEEIANSVYPLLKKKIFEIK